RQETGAGPIFALLERRKPLGLAVSPIRVSAAVNIMSDRRPGTVLAAVLVVLLVALLVCGSLLRVAALHRQQVRSQQHREQAAWLVEAGLGRGAAAAAADPAYQGETWEV